MLQRFSGDLLPVPVYQRLHRDLDRNRARFARLRLCYREIAAALDRARVPFVVLKGLTLQPAFCLNLATRVQYDIDLATAPRDALRARDALAGLGYQPLTELEDFPTDHLPAMIRKTGWQWRGDYFDPEIPISIDLHFRFWDQSTERLPAPGTEDFWDRRTRMHLDGAEIPCLDPVDALGYVSLHVLRHLLRGSLKPIHVYELAFFLDRRRADTAFWERWRTLHPEPLRALQAVSFLLAASWFGPRLAPLVSDQIHSLPGPVLAWFERHAAAPAEALFHPNKSELWLHLSLLGTALDRLSVLRRRLLPLRFPGPVDAVYLPESVLTWRIRLRRRAKYFAFLAGRIAHHLRALPSLVRDRPRLSPFWTFLGASALFNLGLFVFVILYNLYLLRRGFDQSAIGWISGAQAAGSIAGTLPAGWLIHRIGLRATLLAALASTALVLALRATVPSFAALLLLASLAGAAFALWAVSIAPAVAGLMPTHRQARAFSLFFSSSIAVGIFGGWLAGRLSLWLGGLQPALLAGCVLAALALPPIFRLRFPSVAAPERITFPRGPFMVRYLAAFGLWNLATGSFNPFFNVYLSSRFHATAATVGAVFSASQLAQVAALLAAPWILRRLGLARGVSAAMAATAVALACLAGAPALGAAAAACAAYMAFQWMSEPGINTLLMSHVQPQQRGGASALNYLVAFSAQAVAAALAGTLSAHAGFPVLLLIAAGLALASALAFPRLRKQSADSLANQPTVQALPSLPEPEPGNVRR